MTRRLMLAMMWLVLFLIILLTEKYAILSLYCLATGIGLLWYRRFVYGRWLRFW
jgi:hypothetical protein